MWLMPFETMHRVIDVGETMSGQKERFERRTFCKTYNWAVNKLLGIGKHPKYIIIMKSGKKN